LSADVACSIFYFKIFDEKRLNNLFDFLRVCIHKTFLESKDKFYEII